MEEFGWVDLQHVRELANNLQADEGQLTLNLADVRTIDLGGMSEILLGDTPLLPNPAQINRE